MPLNSIHFWPQNTKIWKCKQKFAVLLCYANCHKSNVIEFSQITLLHKRKILRKIKKISSLKIFVFFFNKHFWLILNIYDRWEIFYFRTSATKIFNIFHMKEFFTYFQLHWNFFFLLNFSSIYIHYFWIKTLLHLVT